MERVAVLGAGWGGVSIAADLTTRGFDVNLWNRSQGALEPIRKNKGVTFADARSGEEVTVEIDPNNIKIEIELAIKDAQLIIIAVPAFGQRDIAHRCTPYLQDGQVILLLPGSCGSLEFERIVKEEGNQRDLILCEGLTLPNSGRMIGPAKYNAAWGFVEQVRRKDMTQKRLRFAAFPAVKTKETMQILKDLYLFKAARNVLETGILNTNFIIHPAPFVLNIGVIERTNGEISLLPEGISPSIIKIMEAMDKEKMELCRALGIEAISCDDLYRENGRESVYRMSTASTWFKDRIPDIKSSRYLIEDVPYGCVLWSSLGDLVGVDTPITDSIIRLASAIHQEDFMKTGRTVERLGIAGMDIDTLEVYLREGKELGH